MDTIVGFRRSGRETNSATSSAPRGWVSGAYGEHADALVNALPGLMHDAAAEASQPSTAAWSTDAPERPQRQRGLLLDDLKNLRSALLEVDVPDADVARDRRLRAALSSAIGAADSLALASRWQPTAAYLSVTRAAVDSVLAAAGRRPLA